MSGLVTNFMSTNKKILRKAKQLWHKVGHPVFHYGYIPAIIVFGLVQAGEFTMNPVLLAEKVLVP
jgi:ABC-type Zn2+ transport system substrate-binding protein/surface adhesin